MKKSFATQVLCSIVFIFGVLVGTLMHGHIMWHDVAAAMLAGFVFSGIRVIQFREVTKRVLAKFNRYL